MALIDRLYDEYKNPQHQNFFVELRRKIDQGNIFSIDSLPRDAIAKALKLTWFQRLFLPRSRFSSRVFCLRLYLKKLSDDANSSETRKSSAKELGSVLKGITWGPLLRFRLRRLCNRLKKEYEKNSTTSQRKEEIASIFGMLGTTAGPMIEGNKKLQDTVTGFNQSLFNENTQKIDSAMRIAWGAKQRAELLLTQASVSFKKALGERNESSLSLAEFMTIKKYWIQYNLAFLINRDVQNKYQEFISSSLTETDNPFSVSSLLEKAKLVEAEFSKTKCNEKLLNVKQMAEEEQKKLLEREQEVIERCYPKGVIQALKANMIDKLKSNIALSATKNSDFPTQEHILFFENALKDAYGNSDPFDEKGPAYLFKQENQPALKLLTSNKQLSLLFSYLIVEKQNINLLRAMIQSSGFHENKDELFYPMVLHFAHCSENKLLETVGALCCEAGLLFQFAVMGLDMTPEKWACFNDDQRKNFGMSVFLDKIRCKLREQGFSFEDIKSNRIAYAIFTSKSRLAQCLEMNERPPDVRRQRQAPIRQDGTDGALHDDHAPGAREQEERRQVYKDAQRHAKEDTGGILTQFYNLPGTPPRPTTDCDPQKIKKDIQAYLLENKEKSDMHDQCAIAGELLRLVKEPQLFELYRRAYEHFKAQQPSPAASQPPPASPSQ